ncbi:hypothetical protein ED733_001755 [Metarhizium rileyi]|uniref:Deuterolysin metalloprotease n=1 Tax=Metarhizium rileyi (strain RCEF 4871) TaxID=1649241 RepID=A0A5C6G2Z5_METRR|nr:hypothetical protein ED733_001755 [Metarhizium rileyi]
MSDEDIRRVVDQSPWRMPPVGRNTCELAVQRAIQPLQDRASTSTDAAHVDEATDALQSSICVEEDEAPAPDNNCGEYEFVRRLEEQVLGETTIMAGREELETMAHDLSVTCFSQKQSASYAYVVTSTREFENGIAVIPKDQRGGTDYTYVAFPAENMWSEVPLAYLDAMQAVRAWAELGAPSTSSSALDYRRAHILAFRQVSGSRFGPRGSVYQPGVGWPADQLLWVALLSQGDSHLTADAVRVMSDQELRSILAKLEWQRPTSQRMEEEGEQGRQRSREHTEKCRSVVGQTVQQLLQGTTAADTSEEAHIRETLEERFCGWRDEAGGENMSDAVCDEMSAGRLLEYTASGVAIAEVADRIRAKIPQLQSETARRLAELCAELHMIDGGIDVDGTEYRWEPQPQPQPQPQTHGQTHDQQGGEPIAGPSGLCRQRVSQALEPVRANLNINSQAQKRPASVSSITRDVQQAICGREGSEPLPGDGADMDQPPPKKTSMTAQARRCSQDVAQILGIVGRQGQTLLILYLDSPDEIVNDLCFNENVSRVVVSLAYEEEAPSVATVTAGFQPLWSRFALQVWHLFHFNEQELARNIDAGLPALSQTHDGIHQLLLRDFPSLVPILQEMASQGISVAECVTASTDQRLNARALPSSPGQVDDLCRMLLGARVNLEYSSQAKAEESTSSTTEAVSPANQLVPDKPKHDVNSGSLETKLIEAALGIAITGGGLAIFASSAEGGAVLSSLAASLELPAGLGSVEAVTTVLSHVVRAFTQAVARILVRVSRLLHRVANPLIRDITSRGIRRTIEQAGERIPLLSFSG